MPVGAIVVGGLATVYSSQKSAQSQREASSRAAQLETESNDKALAYTQTKDAQDRADKIAAETASYGQYKADVDRSYQQYLAKQRATAPYRAMGTGAGASLADLLHIQPGPVSAPAPAPVMPPPPTYTTVAAGGAR